MVLKRAAFTALILPVAALCSLGCTDVIVSGDIRSCATAGTWNCQHVVSSDGTRQTVPSGVAYALPKGQVQLAWSRGKPSPADVQKAQAALAIAQAALANDQLAFAKALAKDEKDPTLPALEAKVTASQTAVEAANSGLIAATSAQTSFVETATLTVLPVVPDPDPKAHFVTNLNHSPLRNDSLNVGVSNGLLNSATATSADQTPQILLTLANTAITFASILGTGGALPLGGGRAAREVALSLCRQDSWSVIFDPLNKAEIDAVIDELSMRTQNIILKTYTPDVPALSIAPPTTPQVTGLVYRAMTARTLTLAPSTMPSPGCPLVNPTPAQSIVAVVPDTNTAYVVPARAGAFTTSSFNLAFTNGTLTSYSNQQPSEIAAAVGIPLAIANSLMTIPTSILRLRVDYDSTATALVNQRSALSVAQTNALTAAANAQTQLVQAQSSLTQAQAAAAAAGPTGQAAVVNAQTNLIKALTTALQAQQALNALTPTGAPSATTK